MTVHRMVFTPLNLFLFCVLGARAGRFALPVHGGQEVDVWFKDIELQNLDTP